MISLHGGAASYWSTIDPSSIIFPLSHPLPPPLVQLLQEESEKGVIDSTLSISAAYSVFVSTGPITTITSAESDVKVVIIYQKKVRGPETTFIAVC